MKYGNPTGLGAVSTMEPRSSGQGRSQEAERKKQVRRLRCAARVLKGSLRGSAVEIDSWVPWACNRGQDNEGRHASLRVERRSTYEHSPGSI